MHAPCPTSKPSSATSPIHKWKLGDRRWCDEKPSLNHAVAVVVSERSKALAGLLGRWSGDEVVAELLADEVSEGVAPDLG